MKNICSNTIRSYETDCGTPLATPRTLTLPEYYAKKLAKDGEVEVPVKKLYPNNMYYAKSKVKVRIIAR